jgi:hypothetical protein
MLLLNAVPVFTRNGVDWSWRLADATIGAIQRRPARPR